MSIPFPIREPDGFDPGIISFDEVDRIRRFGQSMETEIRDAIVTGDIGDLRYVFEAHTRPVHIPEDVVVRQAVERVMRRLAHVHEPDAPAIHAEPKWLRPAFELLRQAGHVTQEVWELLMDHRPPRGITRMLDESTIPFDRPHDDDPPRSA